MPPCNCHPPFPRPEPFSPLPRPGKVPDWGKWIRDRLAEKGALLAFPSASAFPDPGAQPNVYEALDTGILYRWDGAHYQVLVDPSAANDVLEYEDRGRFPETGRSGAVYIDASANLIYRWNGAGYVPLTADLADVESRLADVESKVPAQATAQNQLADKEFVNSSVATNTATFRGTFNLVTDLQLPLDATHVQVAQAIRVALVAAGVDPDDNDYVFVQIPQDLEHTDAMKQVDRYKCTMIGSSQTWAYEWTLNNSSFTAAQWAAINSGITSGLVAKLGALPTAEALAQALAGKQNVLTFDNAPTTGSNNPVKSGGIWSAIWGTASTAFSSLYDWCVAQLAGKASTNDAALAPVYGGNGKKYSDWTYLGIPSGYHVKSEPYFYGDGGEWLLELEEDMSSYMLTSDAIPGSDEDLSVSFTWIGEDMDWEVTATRELNPIVGYVLGSQTDKPLASEAEAEALRQGKQSALTAQQLANIAAVPGKADSDGPTITSGMTVQGSIYAERIYTQYNQTQACYGPEAIEVPSGGVAILPTLARGDSGILALTAGTGHAGNLAALDANGNPTDSGVKASDKLNCTSAAPAFSTDSTVSYPVGSHVTYNGKLYVCTTATTGGTWVAGSWTADTMTDPDAVLDITSQNQLRVVAKDGTLLWAQGYDLASTSSATLACDAANNFTFADGATTQAFTLPTAPTGKVGDFGLDIDNSANTGAATMTLTGLDTAFSVVVPEGESLNDMLAIAAGELARFYITLSTFRVNNLPTWHIVKQVVENGGAQS